MACPTGIEPVTPSLEGWCSIRLSYGHHSNRILPHIRMNWSGWRDLNSRHPGPKPGALPGYATPRKGRYYTFPSVKGQFMAFFGKKPSCSHGLLNSSIYPAQSMRKPNDYEWIQSFPIPPRRRLCAHPYPGLQQHHVPYPQRISGYRRPFQ